MIEKSTFPSKMPSSGFLKDSDSSFSNKLLIAMPGLQDGFFNKSVIYLCAHSAAGAMGIVINQPLPEVGFRDLLKQLHLPQSELRVEPVVHYGGPVETGRGFVLHSTDFIREDTVQINDHICVTGTIDIIQAMAEGKGPHKSIFALGYAGWGPGQLESEIQQNSWLTVTPDEELLFNTSLPKKWERALKKLGVDLATLSIEAGHA